MSTLVHCGIGQQPGRVVQSDSKNYALVSLVSINLI